MNRAQFGGRLVHTHSILQERNRAKESSALVCATANRHWQYGPKLRGPARARTLFDVKLKTRRHHAYDREFFIVESYRLANHTCLTAESTLPQGVTEHCYGRLICFI